MNSIESLKLDFNSQIDYLGSIENQKIFDDCVYVGSGDSFAAGLIAEYLTHKCNCYSPSDLLNSRLLADKTYCFVSVTGKTRANIELAHRARESGLRTVAITVNVQSKLAQLCDQVIPLNIPRVKTPTAGFHTFVANVITCLQLLGKHLPNNFDKWHKGAVELSSRLSESMTIPNDTLYILGNNLLYPLALYTSFQMAEFFGTTAAPHKLEEFCHSPIFGLKNSHDVWILGQNEQSLSQKLAELTKRICYIELYNNDSVSQLFESIFFVQNLILLLAQKNGYTELKYVTMKEVLKTSSDIIY